MENYSFYRVREMLVSPSTPDRSIFKSISPSSLNLVQSQQQDGHEQYSQVADKFVISQAMDNYSFAIAREILVSPSTPDTYIFGSFYSSSSNLVHRQQHDKGNIKQLNRNLKEVKVKEKEKEKKSKKD